MREKKMTNLCRRNLQWVEPEVCDVDRDTARLAHMPVRHAVPRMFSTSNCTYAKSNGTKSLNRVSKESLRKEKEKVEKRERLKRASRERLKRESQVEERLKRASRGRDRERECQDREFQERESLNGESQERVSRGGDQERAIKRERKRLMDRSRQSPLVSNDVLPLPCFLAILSPKSYSQYGSAESGIVRAER